MKQVNRRLLLDLGCKPLIFKLRLLISFVLILLTLSVSSIFSLCKVLDWSMVLAESVMRDAIMHKGVLLLVGIVLLRIRSGAFFFLTDLQNLILLLLFSVILYGVFVELFNHLQALEKPVLEMVRRHLKIVADKFLLFLLVSYFVLLLVCLSQLIWVPLPACELELSLVRKPIIFV
jgi:hypothetical protein